MSAVRPVFQDCRWLLRVFHTVSGGEHKEDAQVFAAAGRGRADGDGQQGRECAAREAEQKVLKDEGVSNAILLRWKTETCLKTHHIQVSHCGVVVTPVACGVFSLCFHICLPLQVERQWEILGQVILKVRRSRGVQCK